MKTFKEFLAEHSYLDPGIVKELEDKGYKFLGSGVDQVAFLEPDGKFVLKIFGSASSDKSKLETGFSKDHMMFKKWVQYCEANKDNKFLPKYEGWESFEFNDKKYLQIKVEKLQNLPQEEKHFISDLSKFIDKYLDRIKEGAGALLDAVGYSEDDYQNDSDFNIPHRLLDELNKFVIQNGKDDFELLISTIAELLRMADKNNYNPDFHGGNFMHRNDGTLVISDPWVLRRGA